MTLQERHKLEDWIAENVMDINIRHQGSPCYSTESKPAMDVLKKCAEKKPIWVGILESEWAISLTDSKEKTLMTTADTLELTICLFAKQLFSKK